MNWKELNDKLKNLEKLRFDGDDPVERKTTEENDYEGGYEIFKLSENIYVKLHLSYNYYNFSRRSEEIEGISFVTPKKVVVTDFEEM